MKTSLLLLLLLTSRFLLAQTAVPLGKGSVAAMPPANDNITALYAKTPLLGPKARNRPLPTNDWWTTLLSEEAFPGKLFVMPWIVQPETQGLKLYLPQGWSEGGNELLQGDPLILSGKPKQSQNIDETILLFDFEEEDWSKEWRVTGSAFGKGPMPMIRHGATNMSGSRYACSFWEADQGTGTLTSPMFMLNRDYLHLRVSGGNNSELLGVELVIDNQVVYKALGEQSNDLKPHRWDLKAFRGKPAQLRLVDNSQGGWGFIAADAVILSNEEETKPLGLFTQCSTLDWGDWSVQMGIHTQEKARFEVTMARGMPFVWIEAIDIEPHIQLGSDDRLLNPQGHPIGFPFAGHQLILQREDRLFSIYAAPNTRFEKKGTLLIPQSTAGVAYLIIGALPNLSLADAFSQFAYSIPRQTSFAWEYLPEENKVLTRWNVETENLSGTTSEVLQGWLPHHWRTTEHDVQFTPITYETQRGPMKLSRGNQFEMAYTFAGLPIALPLPPTTASDPTFNVDVLDGWLDQWVTDQKRQPATERAGADTYWGGKEILSLARTATLTDQRNHAQAPEALNHLREAMTDWFTYTPGEPARYFARYSEPWNGLVGFNPSYGSETFSDAHFHHGYFTLTAALLIRLDPQWGRDFKEVATQVAQQYANWDRGSTDFPFLRTFSPWVGHSYAGGQSNANDGNNQESSSESMMGWAGLFLLGSALGNDEMRDCGAMGLAVEAEAIKEYWYDYYAWNDPAQPHVFPEAYRATHTIVGVRRDRDMGYWTWFSGEAIHIYGIQWLPTWTHLLFLQHDPEFVRFQSAEMMKRQGNGLEIDFESLGHDWGHVALSHLMWGDPKRVIELLDDSTKLGRELGSWRNGGVTYAMAQAIRFMGVQTHEIKSNLPTSLVTRDAQGQVWWTGWNPGASPMDILITKDGKEIERFQLLPGKEIILRKLSVID